MLTAAPVTIPFMPLTLPEAGHLEALGWAENIEFWAYRVSGYLLTHLVDDPAWLALLFC